MDYPVTNVHIQADAFLAKKAGLPFVRVDIQSECGFGRSLGAFYIPISTYNRGYKYFVSAIKARAKRDLKIEIGHYSSCGW